MKLNIESGTVTVTLTDDEAYAIFNFTEFATRKGMNWSWDGPLGHRLLHREAGIEGERQTHGLKETRKLAKKLGKVFGWK